MSTAIWIAILTVLSLIGCSWLLIVGCAVTRDRIQPAEEEL